MAPLLIILAIFYQFCETGRSSDFLRPSIRPSSSAISASRQTGCRVQSLAQGGKCGRCSQLQFNGRPVTLAAANFDAHVVRSDIPLLVDFWASSTQTRSRPLPAATQSAPFQRSSSSRMAGKSPANSAPCPNRRSSVGQEAWSERSIVSRTARSRTGVP